MSFVTDATLKTELAAVLKQAEASLPSTWTTIVARANAAAYAEIVRRFTARGYAKTQIDQWDHGVEVQLDLGLYWSLVKGAGLADPSERWIARLDRRAELDTLPLLIAGAPATPAGTPPIGHGDLAWDSGDGDTALQFGPDVEW
jgi:hypothetical protein